MAYTFSFLSSQCLISRRLHLEWVGHDYHLCFLKPLKIDIRLSLSLCSHDQISSASSYPHQLLAVHTQLVNRKPVLKAGLLLPPLSLVSCFLLFAQFGSREFTKGQGRSRERTPAHSVGKIACSYLIRWAEIQADIPSGVPLRAKTSRTTCALKGNYTAFFVFAHLTPVARNRLLKEIIISISY